MVATDLIRFSAHALLAALIFTGAVETWHIVAIEACFGAGWAFALDAATFLVSAAFVIRVRPRRRGEARAPSSLLVDLREGWAEFRARTWVWGRSRSSASC
jgi:hypothetical protein